MLNYAVCCFGSFFFIFAISQLITFFKTIRDLLFQCSAQRLFSVHELIVLEENTAKNPEFDYDRSELADMDSSECKEKFILET